MSAAAAVAGILCVLALTFLAVPPVPLHASELEERTDSCSVVAVGGGAGERPAVTQRLPPVGQQQQQGQCGQQQRRLASGGLRRPLLSDEGGGEDAEIQPHSVQE